MQKYFLLALAFFSWSVAQSSKDLQKQIKEEQKQYELSLQKKDSVSAFVRLEKIEDLYTKILNTELKNSEKTKFLFEKIKNSFQILEWKLSLKNTENTEDLVQKSIENYSELLKLEGNKLNYTHQLKELLQKKRNEYFTNAVLTLQNEKPDYQLAIHCFKMAENAFTIIQKTDAESAFWRGFSLLQINDQAEALVAFLMAAEQNFRKEEAYLVAVQLLNRQFGEEKNKLKVFPKDVPSAKKLAEILQKARVEFPEQPDFLVAEIEFLIQSQQIAKAMEVATSALESGQNYPRLFYIVGLLYTEVGNRLLAEGANIKDVNKAKQNQENCVENYKKAIEFFEKSTQEEELKSVSEENLSRLKTKVQTLDTKKKK